MENKKLGRPKSKGPVRDKRLSVRVTSEELESIQKVCCENELQYIDVILKGLEYWSDKK